ncbi:MAG: alpha/beta fold hydrolase [Acidobacteriota bacterium]
MSGSRIFTCGRFHLLLWVGLTGFPAGAARAQDPSAAKAEEPSPLTPAQVLDRRTLSDVQLSPAEDRVAFTVTEPARGTDQNRDIWVYDLGAAEARRFTTSEKSDRRPRWSPDGTTLAYLSDRKEKTQIFLLPLAGGEAEALTKSETPISSYQWSPKGKSIAYLASQPKTEEEKKKEKEKDDATVVGEDERQARLWVIDVASRETRQLSRGKWRISSYAWMPGGDRLILSATEDSHPESLTDRLYSLDAKDGTFTEIARPSLPFGNLKISPDGRHLAYVGTPGDGPTPHDLFLLPLSGGAPRNLTGASLDRPVSGFTWQGAERLLVQTQDGFGSAFSTLSLEGAAQKRAPFEIPLQGSFAAGSKVLAFVGQSATRAPELWISTQEGQARQVTHLNRGWDEIALVQPEIFHYPSFDGTAIEAALLKPPGYREGVRVPLVVLVHGGPSGRWAHRFDGWGQLLAARGFAVFSPNIRGSTGYGHQFQALNRRDWGGGDFKDVMAGVDSLIDEGIADPERLGIGGWSYGGYMAAWAVTQSRRFKAALSGAPMTDLAFEYGSETHRINAYDTWYMGTPYENLDLFIQRSPLTHVRKVTTPTLILCSERDVIDPVEQCQQFYRGLRRYGVETTYVVYPREGHGLREEKHLLDRLKRILEWFEHHLK